MDAMSQRRQQTLTRPTASKIEKKQPRKVGAPRKCRTSPIGPHVACPFAKIDNDRYLTVYGPCTLPPGIKLKYLKEHIVRHHSAKSACIYCKQEWVDPAKWEQAMHEHITGGACVKVAYIQSRPQWMTAAQQKSIDEFEHPKKRCPEPQAKWLLLFKALFPNCAHEPSATYDYYINKNQSEPANPFAFKDFEAWNEALELGLLPDSQLEPLDLGSPFSSQSQPADNAECLGSQLGPDFASNLHFMDNEPGFEPFS